MGVDVTSFAANEQSLQVQQSLGNVAALTAFTGMLRPPVSPDFVPGAEATEHPAIATVDAQKTGAPAG